MIAAVIGIVLTGIVAAMGLFYGGQAYENAQVQAAANTMVANAEQIANAIRLWSFNNGGTTAFPGTPNNNPGQCRLPASNALTIGGYLEQVPGQWFHSSAANVTGASSFSAGSWSIVSGVSAGCTNIGVLWTLFGGGILVSTYGWPASGAPNATALCNAINAMQGITSIPNYSSASGNFIGPLGNAQFGCEADGGPSSGFYDFIYRIF